ncbi:MAG: SH3 domain-containing protein, partial [Christensenellales bacterium]
GAAGQVSLVKSSIAVGETTVINAQGVTILTATSSNPAVASVSGSVVTGVSAGTATINYITNTGATGSLPITVTAGSGTADPNLPAPTKSYSVSAGATKTFKFSNTNVAEAWTADPSVASATLVTGSDGYKQARFTGLSAGTTTAYMKSASGSVTAITLVVSAGNVVGKTGKINSGDDDLRVIVRKGPGSTYDRLATMSNGIKVTIEGESGSYYKIKFTSSGKTYTGYVKKAFITF